jgi:LysM repeat protein
MDNNESKPQQTGGLKLMTVFIAVLALHVLVIGGFTVYHLMGSGGDADLALDKNHKLRADGTVVTDTTTPDASAADKTADATASTDTATPPSAPATTGTATATAAPAPAANTPATETATPVATTIPAQAPANPPAATATATATPAAAPGGSPIVINGDDMAQTSTIPAGLAPPPDQSSAPSAPEIASVQTPSAPAADHAATLAPAPLPPATSSGPVIPTHQVASGPVHMPANLPKPAVAMNPVLGEEHLSAPEHREHAVAATHDAKKEIYTVKITDSYKKIAEAHHVTVAQLKAANHINDNVLHTGQKLIIPAAKTSLAKSGALHDTMVDETASTASLSASPTGTAKSHRHVYTVAKGDTLSKIAKKFNVSASSIVQANNLPDTKLAIGEKLRIPSHDAHGMTATSAALTDRVITPVAAPLAEPAPIQPSQVETQPAPVVQPAPTQSPAPVLEPQPAPGSSPELTSLNF